MCEMVLNSEKNGVELYFNGKPESTILSMLKECGYRWHNVKKCWYAKQNTETMNTAHKLANNESVNVMPKAYNIKSEQTKENYFPSYDHVGSEKIYKSSDISMMNNHGGYFADIKAYIHFYGESVVIIDLANALKTGKDCNRYSLRLTDYSKDNSLVCELWNNSKIKTFKELFTAIKEGKAFSNMTIEAGTQKGINTFSPFVKVKPIKTPSKWTVAHIWKAILSGQIYKGVKDGYYTDDYAQDAADNFGTGRKLDLIKLADQIIDSGRGWSIRVENEKDGIITLSFDCYSFDSNTLYYDPNCNMVEAVKREQQDEQDKEEYNNNALAQVKNIKPEQLSKTSAYRVTYLEMNNNTKKYEQKTKIMPFNHIFYTDTEYEGDEEREVVESNYQIVSIAEFIPVKNEFYEISNTFSRLNDDTDKRIINAGIYIHYVSGYALSELLTEGFYIPCICETPIPYESLADQIRMYYEPVEHNGMTCRMSSGLFSHEQIDYREEHNKLIQEYLRIPQKTRTA